MNERIKELAKQSLPASYLTNCPSALEKFAELIVRECCSAIRLDDAFNGGKFQRTILEHFGVE
jgi:hypothetical protein